MKLNIESLSGLTSDLDARQIGRMDEKRPTEKISDLPKVFRFFGSISQHGGSASSLRTMSRAGPHLGLAACGLCGLCCLVNEVDPYHLFSPCRRAKKPAINNMLMFRRLSPSFAGMHWAAGHMLAGSEPQI
jgi:hypothetical protein